VCRLILPRQLRATLTVRKGQLDTRRKKMQRARGDGLQGWLKLDERILIDGPAVVDRKKLTIIAKVNG
jgi:hypothetical protein